MSNSADPIPGYAYGNQEVPQSAVSLAQLAELQITAGFTAEDRRYLQRAGEVLADQTKRIVDHWRSGIIAGIPHLAKHSRAPGGEALPDYLAKSNRRFEQWILDTCFKPYDQSWLNYQHEIALRHTTEKKNRTDSVQSTGYVPLRDAINERLRRSITIDDCRSTGHQDRRHERGDRRKHYPTLIALEFKSFRDAVFSQSLSGAPSGK